MSIHLRKEVKIMLMYLLLVIGFVILIKGADIFVDGASSIAGLLKVPSVVIGLTIVSLGTSAPEAAVSVTSSIAGSNGLSLGNVIGSNMFNLLVVIGVCAVAYGVATPKELLARDMKWNIAVTVLLLLVVMDGTVARYEGILLLVIMVAYLAIVIRSAIIHKAKGEDMELMTMPKSILYVLVGLVAVVWGGDLVVDNASLIATSLGMSDTLVGLTVVALGTSLPELATSLTATKKGDSGIALGNAVGSSIFNILFILGLAGSISPIATSSTLVIDAAILLVVTVLMLIFGKSKLRTDRKEGTVFLVLYVAYMAYIIARDGGM